MQSMNSTTRFDPWFPLGLYWVTFSLSQSSVSSFWSLLTSSSLWVQVSPDMTFIFQMFLCLAATLASLASLSSTWWHVLYFSSFCVERSLNNLFSLFSFIFQTFTTFFLHWIAIFQYLLRTKLQVLIFLLWAWKLQLTALCPKSW